MIENIDHDKNGVDIRITPINSASLQIINSK